VLGVGRRITPRNRPKALLLDENEKRRLNNYGGGLLLSQAQTTDRKN